MMQIDLGSLILIQISPERTHLKAYIEDKISYPVSPLGIDYHLCVDIY